MTAPRHELTHWVYLPPSSHDDGVIYCDRGDAAIEVAVGHVSRLADAENYAAWVKFINVRLDRKVAG